MKKFFTNPIAPWILVGMMFLGLVGYIVYEKREPPAPPPVPIPLMPRVETFDSYGLGEQVELNLIPFEVKPEGLQEYSVIWRIFDLTADGKLTEFTKFRKLPDGSILFGAGIQPKEMLVITSVNYLFKKGNGAETKLFVLKTLVKIGQGPLPPPPIPPTPVNPSPFSATGYRVMIIYSSKDDVSKPDLGQIIAGAEVRSYLESRCVVGSDGQTKEYRIWPKDTDATNDSEVWRTAFARPRTSVPWLLVGNGKEGYEGPLPNSVAGVMEILKKIPN